MADIVQSITKLSSYMHQLQFSLFLCPLQLTLDPYLLRSPCLLRRGQTSSRDYDVSTAVFKPLYPLPQSVILTMIWSGITVTDQWNELYQLSVGLLYTANNAIQSWMYPLLSTIPPDCPFLSLSHLRVGMHMRVSPRWR
jgi:hypothetical protein